MIIKYFRVKRDNSNKYDKKVELLCDKCCNLFQMFDAAFKKAEKRHPGKHLCLICSNAREYKKILIGRDNKRFKGGLSPDGYKRIYFEGRNCSEHRVNAEQKLNRKLAKGEEVHHIDGVKLNNSFENLWIFSSRKAHRKCHAEMEKIALSLLNKKIWFNFSNSVYQTETYEIFDSKQKYGRSKTEIIKCQIQDKPNGRYICKYGTNRAAHIYLMEGIIGRKLYRDEVIHHIDGNIYNNSIDNLFLTTRDKHKKMHESLWKCLTVLYKDNVISFKDGEYLIEGHYG